MVISHSYELGIMKTWQRWKNYSKIFPTIFGKTPKSS
ncbi:hypothetical protein MTR67_038641 [Solanum verrucosum]|uniref:Uncharacterized protein n=1 Tax=Solanum verrucosum TaxID=315347 RepID=A0AAF0ZN32_SOLVR|nr:hypothetical protein MTR67_038641 [Solanum verrucosum]